MRREIWADVLQLAKDTPLGREGEFLVEIPGTHVQSSGQFVTVRMTRTQWEMALLDMAPEGEDPDDGSPDPQQVA